MDFSPFLTMQKKLDQTIRSAHNVDSNEIITKKIVALIVEVSEFANELQSFKYWKKNKNIQKNLILEEFVDGIHFFLSLVIYLNADAVIQPVIQSEDVTEQFALTFYEITKIYKELSSSQLKKSFEYYMGIAKLINLSDKEIKEFYLKKHKINLERIKIGY